MTTSEHSSLPWRYDSPSGMMWDADDKLVFAVSENRRARDNARLIVTAVNAHADILAAAKEALGILSSYQAKKCLSTSRTESALQTAIAKAEE
jgi:hypothetical protein